MWVLGRRLGRRRYTQAAAGTMRAAVATQEMRYRFAAKKKNHPGRLAIHLRKDDSHLLAPVGRRCQIHTPLFGWPTPLHAAVVCGGLALPLPRERAAIRPKQDRALEAPGEIWGARDWVFQGAPDMAVI